MPTSGTGRPRGRPRKDAAPAETPAARVLRLKNELEAAEEEVQAEAEKQALLVGRVIVALLQSDPEFRAVVVTRLRDGVKRSTDRAVLDALLRTLSPPKPLPLFERGEAT